MTLPARQRANPPPPTSRAIPRTARTTRAAFEVLEADTRRRFEALAEGLAQGRIDLDDWADTMQTELRRYHLATSVLGAGGANQMVEANFLIAQRKAEEQIGYLNRWVEDMRRGDFPLDAAPRVRQRAKLYAGAGNATFSESRAQRFGVTGLPFHPADGQTACLSNCRCEWEFKQVEGGWDAYYRLGMAEHCEDCSGRAAQANPLRIRDGIVENAV